MALAQAEAMASDSERSANIRRSSSGSRILSSRTAKPASSAAAAAAPPITGGASQPLVWLSERLMTSPARPVSTRRFPGRSTGRPRSGLVPPGSTARHASRLMIPTGTLSRKIHRQPAALAIAPPTDGPISCATEMDAK